jgi:hypothetical protein
MVKKKLKIFKNPDTNYTHGNFDTSQRPKSPSPTRYDYNKLAQRTDDKQSRCTYIFPETGKRCKLNLHMYPTYCHLHTMMVENIYIYKSNLPSAGNGLFAGPYGFKKGQIIGKYSYPWNEVDLDTLKKRCKNKQDCWSYTICNKDRCWDGYDVKSTIMRNINDARGSNYKNNSQFEVINGEIYVVATKDIKHDQEIFVYYGRHYWKYHSYNELKTTKQKK